MKNIPKPPPLNPQPRGFEPPAQDPEWDPRLTDDETMMILRSYLRPSQVSDPAIITFVMHYVTHRSSPDAAEAAGFPRSRGNQLRSKPEIHAAIDALTAKAVQKYGYDAHEAVERAKEIATFDPIELQNADGSYKKKLSELSAPARRAIKSLKVKNIFGTDPNGLPMITGEILEFTFWDKMKGIELLGGEKDVFKKSVVVQHDATENMKSLLLESSQRAEKRIDGMRDVTASLPPAKPQTIDIMPLDTDAKQHHYEDEG